MRMESETVQHIIFPGKISTAYIFHKSYTKKGSTSTYFCRHFFKIQLFWHVAYQMLQIQDLPPKV